MNSKNIEVIASPLEDKIRSASSYVSIQRSIFRVPSILRRHNPGAYSPEAFSIGPIHHGEGRLEATENIKLVYTHHLVSRSAVPLPELMGAVASREEEARRCYAVHIGFEPSELVEILVVDGCFVIELFCRANGVAPKEPDDPIYGPSYLIEALYHDLLLLENQLPWFVIEALFRKTHPSAESRLHQLALSTLRDRFSREVPLCSIEPQEEIKHLLDLIRTSLISFDSEDEGQVERVVDLIPSASRLSEAGIKFKRAECSSILGIKFNKKEGILQVPPLLIEETTESVFRNLICFEQCYSNCKARITSYAILLDKFIDNKKDVKVLCDEEAIHNWLSPEDAIKLFSTLYQDTGVQQFYYQQLCEDLSDYCQKKWPRWRAMYIRNNFSTPWVIVSQVVAAALFLLTFLQTFYTMFPRK